jgi:hypothetical protein
MSPYFAVAQIEDRIREPLKGLTDKEAVANLFLTLWDKPTVELYV